MALKREAFRPTLSLPTPAIAPAAQPALRRNLSMNRPEFYQQMTQEQAPVGQEFSDEEDPELRQPFSLATKELPTTEANFDEQFARIQQGEQRPGLQPGARVRSPDANLVQPIQFQQFYEQFDIISRIGQNKLAAERARASARHLASLQEIMSQQVPGFGGVQYQGGNVSPYKGKGSVSGGLQPYVSYAKNLIKKQFGISNIGGYATSGHIPGSDHYTGKALDVMGGKMNVVNWALKNAGSLRVKYIIHNNKYWEPGKSPVRYTGSNPHTGHVHISFY